MLIIAFIHMKHSVRGTESVKFIRITDHEPVPGDNVISFGWGTTAKKFRAGPFHLRSLRMNVISRDNCYKRLKSYNPVRALHPITSLEICAQAPIGTHCHVSAI